MKTILSFLLLFPTIAVADLYAGYSYGLRLEKETSGYEYEVASRNLFYVGINKDIWRVQVQYSSDKDSSTNGSSQIDYESHEVVAWGKYKLGWTGFDVNYYAGLGLGATWDKVDTSLGAQTVSDTSDREIVLGAILEGTKYIHPKVSVGSDIKLIYSQYYSQRPTVELGLLHISFYF